MKLRYAALVLAATLGVLSSRACAQTTFTIDVAQRRQTIEGLGVTATGTWIPEVVALYSQPDFAKQIGDDLGASIIRLPLPPAFQSAQDLDAATLNNALFDFAAFNPPASFIQNVYKSSPHLNVMLTIWSPPAWMKDNNSTTNGGHLRADRRAHFAKYCAAACLGFERTYGVPIYSLSIQNEPVFVEKYDSCVYTADEMRDTIKAVGAAFKTHGVKSLIMAPEDVADTNRVMKFIDSISADEQALAATSIFNMHGAPSGGWEDMHTRLAPLKKQVWMTETSGESPDWKGGLSIATQIHNALTLGECNAWVYWAITDPTPDEFALMGKDVPTGKYWAAKQFFKFIRPQSVRLNVTPANANILVSAFLNSGERSLTIELINLGTTASDVALTINSMPTGITEFKQFRSAAASNCLPLSSIPVNNENQLKMSLGAQSVTTLQASYPNQ